jgi:WD40 repeat protein
MSVAGAPLSAQNPWPGLASFSEADQAFFRGRAREADELARLVRRERLSVLFGRSGLGKSSLLAAGLAPRLREDLHLPVLLRIDYRAGLAPRQQVWQALAAELARWHVSAEPPRADETLWAYFHRAGAGFWNQRNRPLLPVLVFDQFEELFTQGQADAAARTHAAAFVAELVDLVEDRMPLALQQALEHDPQQAEAYDAGRRGCKIVLSFREDFLAQVEGLRAAMPSVMRNRFRLLPMDLAQARAVVASGGDLVAAEVAPRLLGLAWNNKAEPPPEDGRPLEFDPALLSVICAELNRLRLAAGEAHIELSRLETSGAGILGNFYDRTIAGAGPALKQFVEDELVTPTGVRDSRALDDALARPGVGADEVQRLVDGRLLRMDDRFGVQRLELTHDVLTGVIAERRRTRRAQEAEAAAQVREREAAALQQRNRRRLLFSGVGVVVAGALLLWAASQIRVADLARQQAATAIDAAEQAQRSLAEMETNTRALAQAAASQVAAAARQMQDSQSQAAVSAMQAHEATQRAQGLLRQASASDLIANARDSTEGSFDRSLLLGAVAITHYGHRLDAELGQFARLLASDDRHLLLRVNEAAASVALSPDRSRLALGTADGQVLLIDTATWRESGRWPIHAKRGVQQIAFSADGQRLLSYDGRELAVWRASDGSELARAPWTRPRGGIRRILFSRDGSRIALVPNSGLLWLWTLDGSPQGRLQVEQGGGRCVGLDDSGALQRPVGDHMPAGGQELARSADCQLSVVALPPASANGPSRIALVRPGDGAVLGSLGELRGKPGEASIVFPASSSRHLAVLDDGRLSVWSTQATPVLEPIWLGGGPAPELVDVSPDGRWVAVARGRKLTVYATEGGRERLTATTAEPARAVVFSADSRFVLPLTLRDWGRGGLLSVYRLEPRADAFRRTGAPTSWSAVEFNRSGSVLVTVSGSDFHFWDATDGHFLDVAKRYQLSEFSPDGSHVALLDQDGGYEVRSLAGTPKRVFERSPVGGADAQAMRIALGHGGRLLAVMMPDGAVVVEDVAADRTLLRLEPRAGRRQIAISPDMRLLATAGDDGQVQLHRLAPPFATSALATAHRGGVQRLMFSPDGRWLASGGEDHTALLHDVQTGALRARFDEPHDTQVDWLVFIERGSVLVSGEEKGVRHLWDLRTLKWLGRLGGEGSGVEAVDLSPSERRAAVLDFQGQVVLRRWDRDQLLSDTCALVGRNLSCDEWRQYVPGLPFAKVCPKLPPPPDAPCRGEARRP